LVGLLAILALTGIAAALVNWDLVAVSISIFFGLLASTVWWLLDRRVDPTPAPGVSALLSDHDFRRAKRTSDRWILVAGTPGSGKTALITQMVSAAVSSHDFQSLRIARPPRHAQDASVSAVELRISSGGGPDIDLRIWESNELSPRAGHLPPLSDLDAFVLVTDPTQAAGLGRTFPEGVRLHNTEHDANAAILELADELNGANRQPVTWFVMTKADLLRYSVARQLLTFPIEVGPVWHQQLSRLNVLERRRLAQSLRVEQLDREHEPAFRWGQGSPLLAFSPPPHAQLRAFGGSELLRQIVDIVG